MAVAEEADILRLKAVPGKVKVIKRVLLINPPDTRPPDMLADKVRIGVVAPLGLAYIAAVLEQEGIEVEILDCVAEGQLLGTTYLPIDYDVPGSWHHQVRYGSSDEAIKSRITIFNPDLVGVSCLFSNKRFDAHNVCRIAKQINPTIITLLGGAHPTAMGAENDPSVDAVIRGEGEYQLREIIMGKPGSLQRPDLDSLPFPARHLLNMPKYLYSESPHSGLKENPMATMTTSRGCPSRCEFCAIRGTFGNAYRMRSPENVLSEIDHLITTYGIKEIHFEDDNLTANRKRAMAIFRGIIDRKYDLSLNSPSGLAVFAMDEALLDKMKEAGYYSISLAIESGVPWVLKDLIHKHVDLAKAKQMVAYGRSIGLKVKAFFILGYPGETKKTMRQTVDYAANLGADWNLFFPATALPGTELDKRVRANGWLVDPNQDYRYLFFKPNIRTQEFGPDDVLRAKEEANLLNFEHNVNMKEGRYDRAIEDFGEVVRMYPHLEFAQKALRQARGHG